MNNRTTQQMHTPYIQTQVDDTSQSVTVTDVQSFSSTSPETRYYDYYSSVQEPVKIIESSGGTCYGYIVDLCDREDVYRKAALLQEEVGRVSILINNAGVASALKFLDTPDHMIIRTMDVNIMSHFWTVKAFLSAMLKENKGHIVSIASLAGHVGCVKLVDYCASKYAAVGFDEALRLELEAGGYNINTTVICPYFIQSTGMFDDVHARFIPTLKSSEVADRVITAMRLNEKFAILPSYLQVLLAAKWLNELIDGRHSSSPFAFTIFPVQIS